jgi:hypothetical protein
MPNMDDLSIRHALHQSSTYAHAESAMADIVALELKKTRALRCSQMYQTPKMISELKALLELKKTHVLHYSQMHQAPKMLICP